jgi:GntR family transcriptional regulator, rspAB operon transcriptional repressor
MMGERANSKVEQVYEAVKEAILSGALEPGEPIDKLALCEQLGVSRFPVSAALSRLAFERLVVVEPQHGSFVARISAQDVRERLFIRRAIEGEIAAEAARRLAVVGRTALQENLREAAAAAESRDRSRFYALDVGFHAALTTHLGLKRSGEILDGIRAHLERVRRLLMTPPGRMKETIEEHAAIVDGILVGDGEKARVAMQAHLAQMTELVEKFAGERPELFSA